MLKEDLRALYKKKRNSLDQKKSQDLSFEIANRSLQLNIWNNENYHIFFPIEKQNEIDTKLIIQIIQGKDKNVILPKVNLEENTMTNYLLTDSTLLKVNKLGVSEPISGIEIKPVQLEVVFIPLLSFDKSGHRVGYGGGYYDRLLKNAQGIVLKLDFLFSIQKIELRT